MATTTTAKQGEGHAAHTQTSDRAVGLAGEMHRPIKITVLGAGSGFTPRLLNDVLQISGADRGEIALVDIDESRLSTMHQLVSKLIEKRNATGWTVKSSRDRNEVLRDSDYIIN